MAAPRATVGDTAQVEWTGQGLSVARRADTRQEGKAHQRQAEPQTMIPREPAGRSSPRVPASPSLPDSRKKIIAIDFVINSLSMPSIQTC